MSSAFLLITTLLLSLNQSFARELCSSNKRAEIDGAFKPQNIRKIKVAFFDADSTIRVATSGSVSANHVKDVTLLPYMHKKMKQLFYDNYLIYIVSNQGGVSKKIITCETAEGALVYTIKLMKDEGMIVHGFDYAESDDKYRKPDIGMINKLEKKLKSTFGSSASIDKSLSFMVGDSAYKKDIDITPWGDLGTHFSNSDRLFAEKYQIRFFEAAVFFEWRNFGVDVFTKAEQVKEFIFNCSKSKKCQKVYEYKKSAPIKSRLQNSRF